jgi:hypothetical protein
MLNIKLHYQVRPTERQLKELRTLLETIRELQPVTLSRLTCHVPAGSSVLRQVKKLERAHFIRQDGAAFSVTPLGLTLIDAAKE